MFSVVQGVFRGVVSFLLANGSQVAVRVRADGIPAILVADTHEQAREPLGTLGTPLGTRKAAVHLTCS